MTDTNGKTPNQKPRASRDDHDLAALFHADEKSPPDFISQQILAAAHEAVTDDDNATAAPSNTAVGSQTVPTERPWQRPGHWLAMAASVILAVTVVPLMLRAPDSELRPDSLAPSTTSAEESLPSSADAMAPEAEAVESDEAAAMMQEAEPMAPSSAPMLPAIQLQRRSTFSDRAATEDEMAGAAAKREAVPDRAEDAANGNPAGQAASDVAFRDTPQLWIAHIRQLLQDERYDDALAEYQSFRRRHPRHEPEFRVPVRQ